MTFKLKVTPSLCHAYNNLFMHKLKSLPFKMEADHVFVNCIIAHCPKILVVEILTVGS
jgi:hypothetical protein